MTALNIPVAETEPRRDRWGRYLITPIDGGKPKGFTRSTTVAKALDDQNNLINWGARVTAIGLAQRPDLLALVQATSADDKKTLDGIVERAKEAGGSTNRRDLGTALHSFFEKSIKIPGFQVPAPYAADIAAIHETITALGFEVVPEYSEVVVVLDRFEIAGMSDLFLRHIESGRIVVADLKTGGSVKYGTLGFAIQLSTYANADNIYVYGDAPSDDVRLPMPENIDRDQAVILHAEPGAGSCTPYWLDIATGFRALETALAVRSWRNAKGILTVAAVEVASSEPADPQPSAPANDSEESATAPTVADSTPPVDLLEQRTTWIHTRISDILAAGHRTDIQSRWPEGVAKPKPVRDGTATWSAADIDAVAEVCQFIETRHSMPFGVTDPAELAERAAAKAAADLEKEQRKAAAAIEREQAAAQAKLDALAQRGPVSDESANHPVKPDVVAGLREELRSSPKAIRDLVLAWSRAAKDAEVGWAMGRVKNVPMRAYVASACALELARLDATTRTAVLAELRLAEDEDGNDLYADRAVREGLDVGVLLGQLDTFVCNDLLEAAVEARTAAEPAAA